MVKTARFPYKIIGPGEKVLKHFRWTTDEDVKGISKNLVFYGLNPSPFSRREGYKEFLEVPLSSVSLQGSILLDFAANERHLQAKMTGFLT